MQTPITSSIESGLVDMFAGYSPVALPFSVKVKHLLFPSLFTLSLHSSVSLYSPSSLSISFYSSLTIRQQPEDKALDRKRTKSVITPESRQSMQYEGKTVGQSTSEPWMKVKVSVSPSSLSEWDNRNTFSHVS